MYNLKVQEQTAEMSKRHTLSSPPNDLKNNTKTDSDLRLVHIY